MWLDDDIIAAAQQLLKRKYPGVEGLLPPAVARTSAMHVHHSYFSGEFVQILHVSGNHWIVISNIKSKPGSVSVYDSLNSKTLSPTIKGTVTTFLGRQGEELAVKYRDVQEQNGEDDCGFFAIAFSVSLCAGQDPSKRLYNQAAMRSHLRQCMDDENITPFPLYGFR